MLCVVIIEIPGNPGIFIAEGNILRKLIIEVRISGFSVICGNQAYIDVGNRDECLLSLLPQNSYL